MRVPRRPLPRSVLPRLAALLLLSSPSLAWAQGARPNGDPDAARVVTSDVAAFWRAYDGATLANAAERFQRAYLDVGSPGLADYARGNGAMPNGRVLAATVAARPRFYAAARATTLALDTGRTGRALRDSLRASFRRLKGLVPDAQFPDVYLVVGRLMSGGTVSPRGLLIGVEMYARDAATPDDELTPWERAVTQPAAELPRLIAHELAHFQQPSLAGPPTLLARALREGAAEFVASRVASGRGNAATFAYGVEHEAALWEEFRGAMRGTDVSGWMYQADRAKGRPADLGYFIGYRICEAYYRRASDPAAAIREILRFTDPEAFLAASGYAGAAP